MASTMSAPLYLDATPLLSRRLTGIGRLTARLIEALSQQRPLRLFCSDEAATGADHPLAGREIAIDAPLPDADADVAAWAAALLRRPARPHAPAQAHRHACVYPFTRPAARQFARELSVLHDFTPLLLPWSHTAATRRMFGDFVCRALPLSDRIVAVSHATKHDAGWLCDVAPETIVVAHPGPSLCVRRHAARRAPAAAPPFILVVAAREPRKNAAFVDEWFRASPLVEPDTELWWVGPTGWLWQAPRRAARGQSARRRRLRFLGSVPDAALCALYQRAVCTLYPSLYEGFGFPVLDSLRHGTPVLASFHSALQEFARPGVFYFDPCVLASLDAAYAALRDARPVAIDAAALAATYSWDEMAATVSSLCSLPGAQETEAHR
jgi:glycosyltransferase involved in cell wall biosynthesis